MTAIANLVHDVSLIITPDHAEALGFPYEFSMTDAEGMTVGYDLANFDLLNIYDRLHAYSAWHSCHGKAEKADCPKKNGLTACMAFASGVGYNYPVDLAPEMCMGEFMDVTESAYLALSPVFTHPEDYPSFEAYNRFMEKACHYYMTHGRRLNGYFCYEGDPNEYAYNGLTATAYKFCCRRLTQMLEVFGDDVWEDLS